MDKHRDAYLCDPEKNTACRKASCVYNPEAKRKECFATRRRECARLDVAGMPVQLPERRKSAETLREKLLEIRETVNDAFDAIRKAVFHGNDAG